MDNTDVDVSSLPICPKCNKGHLQQRNGKFGAFLGCTNYPACKYTQPVEGVNLNSEIILKYLMMINNINVRDVSKVIL